MDELKKIDWMMRVLRDELDHLPESHWKEVTQGMFRLMQKRIKCEIARPVANSHPRTL